MGQHHDPEQLEEAFPTLQPLAFKGQFRLMKAEGHFHQLAAGISEDNPPVTFWGQHLFISEQVQLLTFLAGANNN